MAKKSIAIYGATGCRTCERTVLDINYQVSSLNRFAEVLFWPYVMGSRMEDLDAIERLDVCFFTGCVRTVNEREAAGKLREKTKIMVACGACAAFGGMPGLINLQRNSPSPSEGANSPADAMAALPELEPGVSALSQVVPVEYTIPGCPPTPSLVWAAIQALLCGPGSQTNFSYAASRLPENLALAVTSGISPPVGSTFAGEKAVCATCSRAKVEKRLKTVKRPYEDYVTMWDCLLEQGVICQGVATREGCGGLCTAVGIPCRGCFGKAEAIYDPGAKMVSAVSSTFDTDSPSEIAKIVEKLEDLTGAFYRYTLPTQCALLSTSGRDKDADLDH